MKGFRLRNIRHLVEDPNLKNDTINQIRFPDTGFHESLFHDSTLDQPQNIDVLKSWREVVLNVTAEW